MLELPQISYQLPLGVLSSRGNSEPFGTIGEGDWHVLLESIGRFRHGGFSLLTCLDDFSGYFEKHWKIAMEVVGEEGQKYCGMKQSRDDPQRASCSTIMPQLSIKV